MNTVMSIMRKALQEIADKELHSTARADIWMQDKARAALRGDAAQLSAGSAQPKSMWQRQEYDPERSLLEAVHDLAQTPMQRALELLDEAPAAALRALVIEECARIVEHWSLPTIQTPSMWLVDKAGIAAEIRALALPSTEPPAQQVPCPGCDGHECIRNDKYDCRYPGAVANQGGK